MQNRHKIDRIETAGFRTEPEKKLSFFFTVSLLLSAIIIIFSSTVKGADTNIYITSPNIKTGLASETKMAPTRDFTVFGTVEGDTSAVTNLTIAVYDQNRDLVRTVSTDVYTQKGTDNLMLDDFRLTQVYNGRKGSWAEEAADLKKKPMPDLVYDSESDDKNASFLDPSNKAVLTKASDGTIQFAAVVAGGATKDFNMNYNYDSDLKGDGYHLIVTAYDINGNKIDTTLYNSANEEVSSEATGGELLDFSGSNVIFTRYVNYDEKGTHKNNFTALAGKQYKIMEDYFPGYWNQYPAFAEIKGRWCANDYIEYEYAPQVLGVIYAIDSNCATVQEIYRVIQSGSLENGVVKTENGWKLGNQTYLYHYDLGDTAVTGTRRGGNISTLTGTLVPFQKTVSDKLDMNTVYETEAEALEKANNKYNRIAMTRVELYNTAKIAQDAGGENYDVTYYTNKSVQAITRPNTLSPNGKDLIFAKPGQSVGLFGVVTPVNANITEIKTEEVQPYGTTELTVISTLKYTADNSINSVSLSINGPNGGIQTHSTSIGTADPAGSYVREILWNDGTTSKATSLYDFKSLLGSEYFSEEGIYTITSTAQDAKGLYQERMSQTIDLLVTRTGIYSAANQDFTANQLSAADAALDMLIDNNMSPLLSEAYRNAPGSEASKILTQLSGSEQIASISNLVFDPLLPVANRLEMLANKESCSLSSEQPAESLPDHEVWASYLHHWLNIDATEETGAFDVQANGLAIGFDRSLSFGRFGFAYVYEQSQSDGNRQNNKLNDHSVIVYGRTNLINKLWLNGLYGHSFRSFKTERTTGWSGYSSSLESDFSGQGDWLRFRLEREMNLGSLLFIPFAGYENNWNRYDDYKETGGATALSVKTRNENYGWVSGGIRVAHCHDRNSLGLRCMYVSKVSDPDQTDYSASLTGLDGYQYNFSGHGIENNSGWFDLNVELTRALGANTAVILGYNGLYGDRSNGHFMSAGLNSSW